MMFYENQPRNNIHKNFRRAGLTLEELSKSAAILWLGYVTLIVRLKGGLTLGIHSD
jgi:hypothetical protein